MASLKSATSPRIIWDLICVAWLINPAWVPTVSTPAVLEWWLRCFTRDGDERWQKAVPEVAWAVNLTSDSRLALAYGDGTIRWHRAADGEELLAFFPQGRPPLDDPPDSSVLTIFKPDLLTVEASLRSFDSDSPGGAMAKCRRAFELSMFAIAPLGLGLWAS